MSRSPLLIIVCTFALLLPFVSTARAATSYVADSFQITLRTGPGSDNKIIKMLHSDEPLEVVGEQGNWLSVKLNDGTEGWVLKRFITEDLPKTREIERLKKRNAQLAALSGGASGQIDALTKENTSLRSTLTATSKKYQQLQEQFATLQSDASNVLALKKEFASQQAGFKKTTAELERLRIENKGLRASKNLQWFLSGAGVVLVAWLIGFQMGRSKRRKQSSRLF